MAAACSSLSTILKTPFSTPLSSLKFSPKPHQNSSFQLPTAISRREFLNGFSVALLPLAISSPSPPSLAKEIEVGSYLRLRRPTRLSFSSPPRLKTPPLFVQVVASPLIRLTNKPNARIEDIGSPEKLIASLGPFVTGNTLDPDELVETSIEKRGDQTYYKYVLETPYALTGSHNLAKATAKGSTVVLFVASANDKQWQSSEKTLQAILDSFEIGKSLKIGQLTRFA
ncbi:hypothetical protein DH2020_039071 [Rehmannia glutinosa]|uniref:PsbP C-terminal domain-containing protein n=1 Tax=Rehmannia glutinosa TaxID=99300 RepID=A0ABR0UX29_REHGL